MKHRSRRGRRRNRSRASTGRSIGVLLHLAGMGAALSTARAGVVADEPVDSPGAEAAIPEVPGESPEEAISLDETVLLLFEDFDIVVSASRWPGRSSMTPVPVSTITADDIRYSGVGELPELFDFVPGVDALRLDRNRWAVGVRGLHQTFSDRTLFLINGRNASNPVYGGMDLQTQPIFLEDIERVEFVRGAAGGSWGANAFNGVINIIEKDPRETTGLLVSERLSEHGDTRSMLRYGHADETLAWRVSAEFNEIDPSRSLALITNPITDAPSVTEDFRRNARIMLSGRSDPGGVGDTIIDFGIGATHVERSDSPLLALQVDEDERLDLVTAHAKLQRDFGDGREGYVQWHGTFQDIDRPSMWAYTAFDQSIDTQYSFRHGENHLVTLGGTARLVSLDIDASRPTDAISPGSRTERWFGLFVSERWGIDDRWTVESQLRGDWYEPIGIDWAARVALLRTLGDDEAHVVRLAVAKAFRTPQIGLRELESERIPIGGGLFGVNFVPARDVDNEQLYALEAGYTGQLGDGVTVRVDTYYQYYQDLTGSLTLEEPPPLSGRQFYTVDNIGSAVAWGAEGEIRYSSERMSASLWYAYNGFEFRYLVQNARAFVPARHKVGATLRLRPDERLTLNMNYRYSAETSDPYNSEVDEYHRVDLTATLSFGGSNTEIQIGVIDLLDQTDLRVFDQTSTSIAAEPPGRTAFVQLRMRF